ncbi:uncharacterized protein LOC107628369 [Arachis ipaensis]|uniref:uncharacterized protein LOC107628369 n=1 Tax=Arachis ipaensis TaxID=130454 RepID=UPI000A2B5751|nr:uncharacterized protein LOC107628369 [Arachis ipaensis]
MAVLNRRFHMYIKQMNCNPNLIKRNTRRSRSPFSLLRLLRAPTTPFFPLGLLLSPPVTISLGTSPSLPVTDLFLCSSLSSSLAPRSGRHCLQSRRVKVVPMSSQI